ncbi:MAG: exosome complex exonuclease Rrp41 [Methanohalobium sp.]|uniref:exosome complex exonuclease Rrp41 n=1 Tax=Methanohalobium sp. TaxID=2837493 RepID=UPI00397DAE6A
MNNEPKKFIDENGLRVDGRNADEIRPMKVEIGVLSRADGSCYLEWGNNKVISAVYGPRELHPRRMQRPDAAVIRYKYNMASFSVEDRQRPGPSRRSSEISKVSSEAFEPVIMTQFYPNTVIDVFSEILEADAGTRTAAINAATLALIDAGIPLKSLVSACAVGKVDGQLVLDLNKKEDNEGEADLPVAMTQDGEITLIQMDGHLTEDEIKQAMELVKKGCQQILQIQRDTLLKKFGQYEEAESEVQSVPIISESEHKAEPGEVVSEDIFSDESSENQVEDVEEQEPDTSEILDEDTDQSEDDDVDSDEMGFFVEIVNDNDTEGESDDQ